MSRLDSLDSRERDARIAKYDERRRELDAYDRGDQAARNNYAMMSSPAAAKSTAEYWREKLDNEKAEIEQLRRERNSSSPYKDTQKSLRDQEQANSQDKSPSDDTRDISDRERFGNWYDRMGDKQASAQAASKNKQNSFWGRRKNAIIGWGIGGLLIGSVSIMSFPPFAAIAQFGAIVNWVGQATQTVHDVTTGARTMRNVMASARVAAQSAVSSGIRTHIQTGRVGLTGQIVGERYAKKLEEGGVLVHASSALGLFSGITIDMNKFIDTDVFTRRGTTDAQALEWSAWALNMGVEDLPAGTTFEDGKLKFPSSMKYGEVVKIMRGADSVMGESTKLSAAIKARYAARMMGVYPWYNPLGKLNTKVEKSISDWWKGRKREQAQQSSTSGGVAQNGEGDERDPNTGERTQAAQNGQVAGDSIEASGSTAAGGDTPRVNVKSTLTKVGTGAGITSLLLIGLCTMLAANVYAEETAAATAKSLVAMYTAQNAVWGDTKASFSDNGSGNINWDTLNVLSKDLYNDKIPDEFETDEEGQITEISSYMTKSWTDSPAYQATDNGKLVSKDRVPRSLTDMYKDNKSKVAEAGAFLDSIPGVGPLVRGACSETGGWILTGLTLLIPGQVVSNIVSTLILSSPPAKELIGRILDPIIQAGTGRPFDPSQIDPDQRGEAMYYAGEFASNTMFATEGGTLVSPTEAYQNQLIAQEYLNSEWASRPLADRLFDATDSRSAIAKLFNTSGINLSVDSPTGLFTNVAKMIGAVPSFLGSGLIGNKSAQVSAATGVAYETGAPVVQHQPAFMDIIGGGSDADENGESDYDWYVNFTGYKAADPSKKVVSNNVIDLLNGSDGQKYRDYAKQCLGTEIGDASNGYMVKAFESDKAKEQLLVGLKDVGSWQTNDCAAKVSSYSDKDNYQRIALYTWDYQILNGVAWSTLPSDDPESQILYNEIFGGSSSSSETGGGSGGKASFSSVEELSAAFESATHGTGDFDGVAGRQCVDLSWWFVTTYTDLTKAKGHGGYVAANLEKANSGKVTLSHGPPQAPAIFSSLSRKYNAISQKCDGPCGHTGVVVSVNGNQFTTIETYNGAGGVKTNTYTWEPGDDIDFVYLGDVIKGGS